MERYRTTTKRDIIEIESEPHGIMHYRGYGLAVIVRNTSTGDRSELFIDGIKSLAEQLEPLVKSNGGKFKGLKFGIKKASKERSAQYVIDTQISLSQSDIPPEKPISNEEKLWRKISDSY